MPVVIVSVAVYALVALIAWWVMVERAVRRGDLRGGTLLDTAVPGDGLLALLGFALLVLVVALTHPLRSAVIAVKAACWPVTAAVVLYRRATVHTTPGDPPPTPRPSWP